MSSKSSGYFIGGLLIGILGAVCFSTKAIIVKLAYRETQGLPLIEIVKRTYL